MYTPREAFVPFHYRDKRWACLVCHRRAGKTVSCVMELLTRALACKKARPQYAYIAPLFVQAKQIAWEYLKEFGEDVIAKKNESELYVELINGARIYLLGADNPDRLRGLYLDGVVLDEYADMKHRIFAEVIRPALADRNGWAVFIGTPKGENAFYDISEIAKHSDEWFFLVLKASESGLLSHDEIEDMKKVMSEDQAAQELECSFSASIQGAVYAKWVNDKQVIEGAYDATLPVHTAWDLGYDDSTAIWFWQISGQEIRVIDCYENSNQDITFYCDILKSKPYTYDKHYAPHDARNKLLAAGGRSIIEQAYEQGVKMKALNATSQQNQIEAARLILKNTWFEREACKEGLRALRQYQFEYDEDKNTFRSKPRHDWSSHYADAFEIIAQVARAPIEQKIEQTPRFLHEAKAKDIFALDAPTSNQRTRI